MLISFSRAELTERHILKQSALVDYYNDFNVGCAAND